MRERERERYINETADRSDAAVGETILQERQRGGRSVGSEVGDLIAFLFFFPPLYASRFERAIRRSRNVAREASRRCKRQLDR